MPGNWPVSIRLSPFSVDYVQYADKTPANAINKGPTNTDTNVGPKLNKTVAAWGLLLAGVWDGRRGARQHRWPNGVFEQNRRPVIGPHRMHNPLHEDDGGSLVQKDGTYYPHGAVPAA